MPEGMGAVEPVAMTVAIDDWARSVRRWSALIGEQPVATDAADGRKRARFASRNFAALDLIEAGGTVRAGDCTVVLVPHDLDARIKALRALDIPVEVTESGDVRVAAEHVNGVEIVLSNRRPEQIGPPMSPLPYVFDVAVRDIEAAVPVWDAVLGVEGVWTPIETDSARQFRMHHYVVDGETHAVGLMELDENQFIKRDSLGSSQQFILRTRGDGLLCLGFLYKTDLDEHIAAIPDAERDLLLFEEPRSYLMGRNNMSHADRTGGVVVIVAQHFEGWSGDLDTVHDLAADSN